MTAEVRAPPRGLSLLSELRLLGLLWLTGCSEGPAGLPALSLGPGLTEVFATSYSAIRSSQRLVITDDGQWERFWADAHATVSPIPARPDVDLRQQVLIAVALGERPSGGFVIHIDSARAATDGREVFLTKYRPGSRCGTTGALTQPIHVVSVAAVAGSTRYIESEQEYNCD
jgi:hypothetical protein